MPKRKTQKEFDTVYNAIFQGVKHPEVKPLKGQEHGTQTYQEQ